MGTTDLASRIGDCIATALVVMVVSVTATVVGGLRLWNKIRRGERMPPQ